jgi:membrane peptidoglycan carboxypeptidase
MQSFEPLLATSASFDPEAMTAIRTGLAGATVDGTAKDAFAGFPASSGIAGKTGTAQVAGKADFALFAGYGPVAEPKYSIAVVLEQAGFGGQAAAPAARTLFDYLVAGTPLPQREPFTEPEPLVLPPEVDENGNLVNEFGQRIDALGNVLTPEQIAALDAADPAAAVAVDPAVPPPPPAPTPEGANSP